VGVFDINGAPTSAVDANDSRDMAWLGAMDPALQCGAA
jgi:hypothetical protein